MKRFLLLLMVFFSLTAFVSAPSQTTPIVDGVCKGKKLCGRVYVTSDRALANFFVRVTECKPDLEVRTCEYVYPLQQPGDWCFVDDRCIADFSICFVDCCEDFTIKYRDY